MPSQAIVRFVVAVACAFALGAPVAAKEAPPEAADPVLEARMVRITSELRCLVCQNQTIADSNAALAVDLRREARALIKQGKSDDEVVAYMTERYGDFVLYRPPLKATTFLLWFGPAVMLVAGAAVLVVVLRRRSRMSRRRVRARRRGRDRGRRAGAGRRARRCGRGPRHRTEFMKRAVPSGIDAGTRQTPSLRLIGGLAIGVLAVAAFGYWQTGSPALALHGADAKQVAAADATAPAASGASAMEQIAAMVDNLAERMKQHPDDAEGWTMLARSYTVLGRFDDALPAYRRAIALLPNNATLLADYADAIAATKGSANNPESEALVAQALRLEPNHVKALALAGTAAYDRGDFAGAVARWQKIVDQLPPDGELAQKVQASIAEARERAGGTVAQAAPPASRDGAATGTPAATGKVSGTVTLAPALRAQAAPDDTVFIFARPAGGGRMPLAVRRAKVADLPLAFTLDDSMAMAPGMTISSAKQRDRERAHQQERQCPAAARRPGGRIACGRSGSERHRDRDRQRRQPAVAARALATSAAAVRRRRAAFSRSSSAARRRGSRAGPRSARADRSGRRGPTAARRG